MVLYEDYIRGGLHSLRIALNELELYITGWLQSLGIERWLLRELELYEDYVTDGVHSLRIESRPTFILSNSSN